MMSRGESSGGPGSATKKRKKSNVSMGLTLGIALGLVAGTVLWAATNVIGLGVGALIGLIFGLGIGKLFDAEDPRKKSKKGAGSRQRRVSSGRR